MPNVLPSMRFNSCLACRCPFGGVEVKLVLPMRRLGFVAGRVSQLELVNSERLSTSDSLMKRFPIVGRRPHVASSQFGAAAGFPPVSSGLSNEHPRGFVFR